jgi:poly-gamma-glutamate synthesis protein (capsule biosynthesis protein)
MILTGDVNLVGVTDADVPFSKIAPTLREADVLFANLECCLYQPPGQRSEDEEGFYATPAMGSVLKAVGFDAVGNANNVNYGSDAITSSCKELDAMGILHTGAGIDADAARAPVIVEKDGVRYGFMQRTSVYWPNNQEAADNFAGVAVIKGQTAYRVRLEFRRAMTRPGVVPDIVTWADPEYLDRFRGDVASLRTDCDVLVASHHWGLDEVVLRYQKEIAHAAIDEGADIVLGHGVHFPLGVEIYRDKPILYGLGNFCFQLGHQGRKHGNWIGMMARVTVSDGEIVKVSLSLVRQTGRNETILRSVADEPAEMETIIARCRELGTEIEADGEEMCVWQKS